MRTCVWSTRAVEVLGVEVLIAPVVVSSVASARRRSRIVIAAAAITLVIDQITKVWAVEALDDQRIDVVWKLRLNLVHNTGFAFSAGEGMGPVLGLIALVIAVALWRTRQRMQGAVGLVAIGLVLGGALGNLVDRLLRGEAWLRGGVVDFIDFRFWPVFNFADMGIVVGVVLMCLSLWHTDRAARDA